mmetsp:Transcript_100274/g.280950  ORF Transcript_100274/g.280950 Transcript_100274/m.280950 type:complete len:350 (-) Transcript_100274:56-1105(-)
MVPPRARPQPGPEGLRPARRQGQRREPHHARPPPRGAAGGEGHLGVGEEAGTEGAGGRGAQGAAVLGLREEPQPGERAAQRPGLGLERHLGPHPGPHRRHPRDRRVEDLPRGRHRHEQVPLGPAPVGAAGLQVDLPQRQLQLRREDAPGRQQLRPLLHQGLRRVHGRRAELLAGGRPEAGPLGGHEGEGQGPVGPQQGPGHVQRQQRAQRRGFRGGALLHRLLHHRLLRQGARGLQGGVPGLGHELPRLRRGPAAPPPRAPRLQGGRRETQGPGARAGLPLPPHVQPREGRGQENAGEAPRPSGRRRLRGEASRRRRRLRVPPGAVVARFCSVSRIARLCFASGCLHLI